MFNEWYIPGKGTAKNKPQVRISNHFISVSRYCIEQYFNKKKKVRIGYDKDNNRLYIMPVEDSDEIGLMLIGKDTDNFKYLNAKNFISENSLSPQSKRRSVRYECSWDKDNKYLVVENVKK